MKLEELNEFHPNRVDLELYETFKDTLESMQGDIGPFSAFKLADIAVRLEEYYNTYLIKAEGYMDDVKTEYEVLFAKKSSELGKNVSDGDRQASKDEEVVEQKKHLNKIKRYVNYLKGVVDDLERKHLLLKKRYDKGEEEAKRSG